MTYFATTLVGSSSENFEYLNFDLLRISKNRARNFEFLNFDSLKISNRARRGAVLGDGLTGTWGHQLVATHFVKVG